MIHRAPCLFLIVGAVAACSGGDPRPATTCPGATGCPGKETGDATASRPPTDEAGTPAAVPDDAATSASPASDAASGTPVLDAGQPSKDGSAPGTLADVKPSAGCGSPAPAAGNSTMDVGGMTRQYILTLPKNYDATKRYKLVFGWHGLGGTAAQVATDYYGLEPQANNGTLFVAAQGLQTTNSVGSGPGWANVNGQDVAFAKALYAKLQGQLCFDENRVFSVGMSYGGIMSDTVGCAMGDVFRAIAPMSGAGPGGKASCVGQVAVWSSHGNNDTTVPTAQGEASRDYWVKANHCAMTSKPVDPSPCIAYDGCDADYPVTWCEFDGGHVEPPFASKAIWAFFSQF
jgi:polyhydroxybutyrate depolymerase